MATKKRDTTSKSEATLGDILRKGQMFWLSEDEKEDMSDGRTPFTVSKIASTNDKKYGPRWELTINVEGEERGLTIPKHKARDEVIEGLMEYIARNGSAGPLRIKVKPFGGDRTWISLHQVQGR